MSYMLVELSFSITDTILGAELSSGNYYAKNLSKKKLKTKRGGT